MARYRWLRAEYNDNGFNRLKHEVTKSTYNEGAGNGFRLNMVRENLLAGKYIIKKVIEENTVDPFDNIIAFQRTIYESHNFLITNEFPHIRLIGPPRSSQVLLNKLSILSDFNIFMSQINVNIEKWLQSVEEITQSNCIVKKLYCSGITLASSVKGQAIITGSEDVRKYLNQMVNGRQCMIDRAKVSIKIFDQLIDCELTRNASINISNRDDRFIDILSQSLKRTCNIT